VSAASPCAQHELRVVDARNPASRRCGTTSSSGRWSTRGSARYSPRSNPPTYLKEQLRDPFCQLSGGPCRYEADTMKASRAELGIRKADFNALVDVLQVAMDARQMPFRDQNRLLALLAPVHRDIITRQRALAWRTALV
jgi:hypothetical protein